MTYIFYRNYAVQGRIVCRGRYICWNKTLPMMEAVDIIKARLPAYARRLPSRRLPNFVVNIAAYFKDRGTRDYLHTNLGNLLAYVCS
jgi:hypothetical protein